MSDVTATGKSFGRKERHRRVRIQWSKPCGFESPFRILLQISVLENWRGGYPPGLGEQRVECGAIQGATVLAPPRGAWPRDQENDCKTPHLEPSVVDVRANPYSASLSSATTHGRREKYTKIGKLRDTVRSPASDCRGLVTSMSNSQDDESVSSPNDPESTRMLVQTAMAITVLDRNFKELSPSVRLRELRNAPRNRCCGG